MTSFVFAGGMGRSGTSLLRYILDSHSEIAARPEFDTLHAILDQYRLTISKIRSRRLSAYVDVESANRSFRALIESLLAPYAERQNKRIVLEKTPSNVWYFRDLATLFPDAKFIHLVRDGRDVVCSHLEVGQRFAERGEHVEEALTDIASAALLWSDTAKIGHAMCGPQSELFKAGRVCTLRYHDLVFYPEPECRRLCAFLDVPFEHGMLEPHHHHHDVVIDGTWVPAHAVNNPIDPSRVGRWRKDMRQLRDRVLFAVLAQPSLSLYNFEKDTSWVLQGIDADPSRLHKELQAAVVEAEQFAIGRGILSPREQV
jgi:hypothetical protein